MKPSRSTKIQQLMKQYAAIGMLYRNGLQKGAEEPDVTITVQRADPTFMYRQADNVLGYGQFVSKQGGMRGTRNEYIWAVAYDGRPSVRMTWNKFEAHKVKDLFNRLFTEALYLIWVTEYDWFESVTGPEDSQGIEFGPHAGREINYTVYESPKGETFRELIKRTNVLSNVEITTDRLMQAISNQDPDFEALRNSLRDLCHSFERRVYEQGLKEVIEKSDARGMSGVFFGVELRSYILAGRMMLTFEGPNSDDPEIRDSFTMIGQDPPSKANLGMQSIFCTGDRARQLVRTVIDAWTRTLVTERSKVFTGNANVSIA
jgi:hypothetical protein